MQLRRPSASTHGGQGYGISLTAQGFTQGFCKGPTRPGDCPDSVDRSQGSTKVSVETEMNRYPKLIGLRQPIVE